MTHLEWDIVYWVVFVFGQGLFLLKRADLARRSVLNGVASIGNFFHLNWVTILFRSALEFAFPFYVYRHELADWVVQHVFMLNISFHIPQNLVLCFLLGLFADYLMDWAAMQNKVAGIPVPSWLKETIPQLPQVQEMVDRLSPKV